MKYETLDHEARDYKDDAIHDRLYKVHCWDWKSVAYVLTHVLCNSQNTRSQ